jgi:DNA polymerase III delta prime subunit
MNFDNIWIERHRPCTLNELVLTKENRIFFENLKKKQEIPHLLFASSPGGGKTTLAKIIVNDILENCQHLYINASDENNVDTVRSKITGFSKTKSFDGGLKVVILDEACGMGVDAQKILRPVLEEYAGTTRFILTCNYLFKIIPALQSRCQIFNLNPPIEGAVQRVCEILKKENITVDPAQKPLLIEHIKKNLPDLRRIVGDIEMYSSTGTLDIKQNNCSEFAQGILQQVLQRKDLIKLRKHVIENEREFSNDYRHLMKLIFEETFNSELSSEQRANIMLVVAKSMYNDAIVVDKEVNFFAMLVEMSRV